VEVLCMPASAGAKIATLQLASDDPDEPVVQVALSATAVEPLIAVSPASRDFGDVRVGKAVSRLIRVRNDGSAPLLVAVTDLGGPGAPSFAVISGGAPFIVAAGATHDVEIRFRPGTAGPKSATMRIASDALRDPEVLVPLTGTGTAPDIAAPAGHDFGDGRVGTIVSRSLEVRNEGTIDLLVNAAEIAGSDRTEFRLSASGGFLVPPGASATIDVSWHAATAGPKSAVLRVASDDPDEPSIEIALAGRGIAPDIGVEPGDLDSGTTLVAPGDGAEVEILATNAGTEPLAVQGSDGDGTQDPSAPHDLSVANRTVITNVHPNPSAGEAEIQYALPAASEVTIVVYDATGRRVRSVVDAVLPRGRHAARWDGRDDSGRSAASGIYFVRLTAAHESSIAKLVLRR
jgi:hypothetical protein